MASFMGLFRRWLDPLDEDDNSDNQRQPTPSDGSNDDSRQSELVSNSQMETERQKALESAFQRLQAELRTAKEETTYLQSQHMAALATMESEYQRLSSELKAEIKALNHRWLAERKKSEQLEKTTEDQKTRQQLRMQQESNARQLKELQDTIDKQDKIIKNQSRETLSLRIGYQEALDAKEADCHRLNEQLKEVSRRLEDEVKVYVAEQKRREKTETRLEAQTEKMRQLNAQHKDTVGQLNVVKKSLAKQTKQLMEERTKLDSVEKQYKETLGRKETECEQLEQRVVDMNSTLEYQAKEMNSERRNNELLEKVIKENKELVLQLESQHSQQVNKLERTVDQQSKKLEEEKRKTTEVEKQRDQALISEELNSQKFHQDITDLDNRFKSQSTALQEERDLRQALEMQLEEQKKIECQKDKALEIEKQARVALEMQLKEKEKVECQKDKAFEMEKQARVALEMQLEEKKKIECQKDMVFKLEKQARVAIEMQFKEQKESELQKNKALEMQSQARVAFEMQLEKQKKKIECQKDAALEMEKQSRKALEMQLEEKKKIEGQKDEALEMEKQSRKALEMQLEEKKKIEGQKNEALEMEKQSRKALEMQLEEKKKIEKQSREAHQLQLEEQKKIQCQKDNKLQNSVKQLSVYREEILFLTKEVETQLEKNVLLEKDHQEIVRRANYDSETLRATVAELQKRLENQAKGLTMERQKGEELEKQFRRQSDVLKHEQCQLGQTRKKLDELKEMFSRIEIELSNERLQNAFVDIDHRTLIAAKHLEFNDCKRQLTETREQLTETREQLTETREQLAETREQLTETRVQLTETREQFTETREQLTETREQLTETREQLTETREQLTETREQLTKTREQLTENREQLEYQTQQLAIEREMREAVDRKLDDQKMQQQETEEKHKKQLKDFVEENQKLFAELSLVRKKLERGKEGLERERQTRHDIQEQKKQLMVERDALMERAAMEKKKLTNRISELETKERSRAENSVSRDDQRRKRPGIQSKESTSAQSYDTTIYQVIYQRDNEAMSMRNFDSELRQNEEAKMRLKPSAIQLDELMERISDLNEALKEEKRKSWQLTIQRRYMQSQRDKISQQLQFVRQKTGVEQEKTSFRQEKQDMELLAKVDEDPKETSTDSQEKVQFINPSNWTLEKNTQKAAKPAIGEECTTSNLLNLLRLDETKIQGLREKMKSLQRPGDKAEAAVTHEGTQTNERHQEEQKIDMLTKIKEEPMETKYSEMQMEVKLSLPDEEDPPPQTKRRRLKVPVSTDTCLAAPLTAGGVEAIEIKPMQSIKEEPVEELVEEPIIRTPIIATSKDRRKEAGPIAKQEPKEEQGPSIQKEPQRSGTLFSFRPVPSPCITTDVTTNAAASAANDVTSSGPTESVVQSSPEEMRLIQILKLDSLKTPLTGVAVLNGSLFVVSEMNSVIEVYDSTNFTFSGKVSVEDLTNPQFLTSCPINSYLYILNRAEPSNAIYRLGLAPDWLHHKWLIGTDFGALASTSTGSLLLSCFDLSIKEFSFSGELIRQFQFEQSASDLRLFGAVQLPTTTRIAETASASPEAQFAISYSHRRTGLRRVCTVDSNGQVVRPLLRYNGSCTNQHLIVGRHSGTLFLADFVLGEVFQWSAELRSCRTIRREKDSGFRPLRICLDQNDRRIIIAEVSISNNASKLSIYDL